MGKQTADLVASLGGPAKIQKRLAEMGFEITRQAVSYWQISDRIGGEFRLPVIVMCQQAGIDWTGHDALRMQFGMALKAVKNAHKAQAAA